MCAVWGIIKESAGVLCTGELLQQPLGVPHVLAEDILMKHGTNVLCMCNLKILKRRFLK